MGAFHRLEPLPVAPVRLLRLVLPRAAARPIGVGFSPPMVHGLISVCDPSAQYLHEARFYGAVSEQLKLQTPNGTSSARCALLQTSVGGACVPARA